MHRRDTMLVGAVVALTFGAAALRFSTIAIQPFWFDESVTAALLRLNFSRMLETLPASESAPPLYYVIAWGWTKVFGVSAGSLRAVSALAGTLTVPVGFAAARELFGPRTAVITAALLATNPWLLWYSQEARAYALLVFLGTCSVLFFARSLHRPSPGSLAGWGASAALALATHYFAVFLVFAEATWLLRARLPRRLMAMGLAPIVVTAAALLPLALSQRRNPARFADTPLAPRVHRALKEFVAGPTGFGSHRELVAVVLTLGPLLFLAWAKRKQDWKRVAVVAGLVLVAGGLPTLLATVGVDYVEPRNLIATAIPALLLVAAGLAAARPSAIGVAATLTLVTFWIGMSIAVATTQSRQRSSANSLLLTAYGFHTPRAVFDVVYRPAEERMAVARCPNDYYLVGGGISWITDRQDARGLRGVAHPGSNSWVGEVLSRPRRADVYVSAAVCGSSPRPRMSPLAQAEFSANLGHRRLNPRPRAAAATFAARRPRRRRSPATRSG